MKKLLQNILLMGILLLIAYTLVFTLIFSFCIVNWDFTLVMEYSTKVVGNWESLLELVVMFGTMLWVFEKIKL